MIGAGDPTTQTLQIGHNSTLKWDFQPEQETVQDAFYQRTRKCRYLAGE